MFPSLRRARRHGRSAGPRSRGAVALAIASLAALGVGLFLTLPPTPIAATAYRPAPGVPLRGALAPNAALRGTRLLGAGRVHGAEDVAVDELGRVYGGAADGTIVRITPAGAAGGEDRLETFARTGGRPLGLRFDGAGNLLVADGVRGLLRIDPGGAVETLATGAGGVPFRFTDGVDVARDGTIYFSDASSRWGPRDYLYDLLEARPNGRLLAWDPASRQARVLLDGLYFANGVALAADESFLLVNETYRYRITRYWLRGPQRGRSDTFADRLPGFADGVASDGRGTFWVAFFTVRNRVADALHPHPWAKELLARLPHALWPKAEPYGLLVAFDESGRAVRSLHDPHGRVVPEITSVRPWRGDLYLGSLHGDWIGRYRPGG